MIFFLIARTATPAFLLCAPTVMWALTLTAAAVRVALPATPELVAGALSIGLGCAGGLAAPLSPNDRSPPVDYALF